MNLPFFYIKDYNASQKQVLLDEDNSRHVVQVLRMKAGEQLHLTDGNGYLLTAEIKDDHKKHCLVEIIKASHKEQGKKRTTIAISLLKNSNRFEWFLEKATEIGVNEIVPLLCERTEKEKFRTERLQQICISAMLQSQQCWLPALREPASFNDFVNSPYDNYEKLIAHCREDDKRSLSSQQTQSFNRLICIGPEGDFTANEIALALQQDFIPVSLGDTRLRTETAGIVAASLLAT